MNRLVRRHGVCFWVERIVGNPEYYPGISRIEVQEQWTLGEIAQSHRWLDVQQLRRRKRQESFDDEVDT